MCNGICTLNMKHIFDKEVNVRSIFKSTEEQDLCKSILKAISHPKKIKFCQQLFTNPRNIESLKMSFGKMSQYFFVYTMKVNGT